MQKAELLYLKEEVAFGLNGLYFVGYLLCLLSYMEIAPGGCSFYPGGWNEHGFNTNISSLDLLKIIPSNCCLLWYLVEYYCLMSVHTLSC